MEELLAEDLIGWLFRLGVIVGSVVGVHYYLSKRRCYHLANKIPGPPGLPIIGHALLFIRGVDRIYKDVWNMPGIKNLFKLWFGPRLFIFMANPADIELVLRNQDHVIKPAECKLFEPWLGDGVAIASGTKWKNQRKLIAPMFHLSILKSFMSAFNSKSRNMMDKLQNVVGKSFDCYNYISEATLEILIVCSKVCLTVHGKTLNETVIVAIAVLTWINKRIAITNIVKEINTAFSTAKTVLGVSQEQDGGQEYVRAVRKIYEIVRYRHFYLHPVTIFNFTKNGKLQEKLIDVIHNFTRKALKTRKQKYIKNDNSLPRNCFFLEDINGNVSMNGENNELGCLTKIEDQTVRLALIDLMIDSFQRGEFFMETEIHNQLDTIMLEGLDTTAITSSYFLSMMAKHPDIQDKCAEELKGIFGDSDRPVTFQDTLEMKYIERCLMETLRMYPPVPIIARELKQEVKLKSTNLTIPADCTVIIDVHQLHMREDLYPNSHVFNPDNFLQENSASRHYYSYIPFSAGPKSCVGRKYSMLKMKVLLATVLRKYKILPLSNHRDLNINACHIVKRTDGFHIRIETRKKLV